MSTTLMTSESYMLTSESVTEGHPDKLCDQISDGVLDAILAQDPQGRVACETATTTGLVLIAGEITTNSYVDIPAIARDVIRDAGYTRAKYGFDYETCGVIVSIKEQSGDIALGVNRSLEAKEQELPIQESHNFDLIGAGDQGMMIGFACNDTPELMPMTISLAHKLCRRMAAIRKDGSLPYLRPDGKSQVTVEYRYGVPVRVDTVVLSSQHDPNATHSQIESDLIENVVMKVIPADLLDANTKVPRESHGALRGRRADGGCGAHGAENYRRHLWRCGPTRWRRLLRQGPDQGRPLRQLCGPLRCQEPGSRGTRGQAGSATFLRHWRGPPHFRSRRDLWHGQSPR